MAGLHWVMVTVIVWVDVEVVVASAIAKLRPAAMTAKML